jgi:hypothetical protein
MGRLMNISLKSPDLSSRLFGIFYALTDPYSNNCEAFKSFGTN